MSPVPVKTALLIALRRHGEGYGLQLIDWIREDTGGLRFAQGRVYPALRELEEEGLATSRTGDPLPERGGRPRIYYRLTSKGQLEADDARETLSIFIAGLVPQGA